MKNLLRTLVFSLLFPVSLSYADSWTGPDKEKHAILGAAVGSVVTLGTGSAQYGCATAAGVGLAKELYDYKHRDRHDPSFKDFAVTAIAGCLSSAGTQIILTNNFIGVRKSF